VSEREFGAHVAAISTAPAPDTDDLFLAVVVAGGLPSLWPSSGIESQHVGLDNEVNPSALSIVLPRGPRCQV
jgi:hypothetical protein